jgi:hypothetical protein
MKRKLSLLAALLGLVFMFGCAGKLIYVKDAKLFKVKDNGTDQVQIIPQPSPVTGDKFHRPDVNHEGDRVAFTSNTFDVGGVGTIWTMNIDGTSAKQINLAGSDSTTPRWRPDDERFIAYYGEDTAGDFGINIVRTDLGSPANGDRICDTDVWDYAGFDFNKSPSGPLQIIFSHYETSDHSFKLYRRQVEVVPSCTGSDELIIPYPPPGVALADLDETRPVISFTQNMLVSAVRWSSVAGIVAGIRIRDVDQNGRIGLPLTIQFQGLERITGVSFADKDKRIYFSAKTTAGDDNLYYISVRHILEAISDLANLTLTEISSALQVDPEKIEVGPGKNVWPSGINVP